MINRRNVNTPILGDFRKIYILYKANLPVNSNQLQDQGKNALELINIVAFGRLSLVRKKPHKLNGLC
jgi:hypothetical protein